MSTLPWRKFEGSPGGSLRLWLAVAAVGLLAVMGPCARSLHGAAPPVVTSVG
jgi:hypothetical protein